MYNNLLQSIIRTVNSTVKTPNAYEELDATYDMMFAPERYVEYRERRRRQEDIGNKLILGATGLAVVGELAHLAHRSGIVKKVFKK